MSGKTSRVISRSCFILFYFLTIQKRFEATYAEKLFAAASSALVARFSVNAHGVHILLASYFPFLLRLYHFFILSLFPPLSWLALHFSKSKPLNPPSLLRSDPVVPFSHFLSIFSPLRLFSPSFILNFSPLCHISLPPTFSLSISLKGGPLHNCIEAIEVLGAQRLYSNLCAIFQEPGSAQNCTYHLLLCVSPWLCVFTVYVCVRTVRLCIWPLSPEYRSNSNQQRAEICRGRNF